MTSGHDARVPRTRPLESCPVCGGGGSEERFTLPDGLHGVPGCYRYVACAGCGSIYQSPMVVAEDLPLCYPSEYYTHHADDEGAGDDEADRPRPGDDHEARDYEADAPEAGAHEARDHEAEAPIEGSDSSHPDERSKLRGLRDRLRFWVRWAVQGGEGEVPSLPGRLAGLVAARSRMLRERAFFGLVDPVVPRSEAPGDALEIGAGSGWELSLLERVGWNAEGVEIDPAAARVARRIHGVRVRVGDFLRVVEDDECFDLVYLSHVLEHLPDPHAAFRFFANHLRRGGRAVVVYPNPDGLGARLWKSDWWGWDPPRHLVLPSIDGIRVLADAYDLRARVTTRARQASFLRAATRWKRERSTEEVDPRVLDVAYGLVEGAMVAAGAPLGEEVVAVLERGRERGP